jgi:sulfur-oxidizing protein SoxA
MLNKKTMLAAACVAAAVSCVVLQRAGADPVKEELIVDGNKIITRAKAPEGLPFDEVRSGWLYREKDTRELEADSFENPGMLYVDKGQKIWNKVEGAAGKSCATCHQSAAKSMKGVGASYPKWDAASKRPIDIELQIDKCRVEKMGAQAYKFDDPDQAALTTFIKHQSFGMPVHVDLSKGDMKAWWEKGKQEYYTRTGQLNLACASCHEQNNGKHIRADHLSQGNANGFPTYRLKQSHMISLQNRFRGCIRDTRAEIPKAFSDELMALELYVTWRGTGLSVETPAVRQ